MEISKIPYGNPPTVIGKIDLDPQEMMFYLYLPIKMAGRTFLRIPDRLVYLKPLIQNVIDDAETKLGLWNYYDNHYIYLTAKTMYVEGSFAGNRPGLHADGYGSNGDLNYIWHNMNPTEFAVQPFIDIPDDDIESMKEMERQFDPLQMRTYDNCTLLRLDESVVHRVSPTVQAGIRTFIKISVSKHRYNLKGNSHNYLFDYDWDLADRQVLRNCDNKDFVK